MAEKGIIVSDAESGESVACRDAVQKDNDSNARIIQLVDSSGRKSGLDLTTPTRSLDISVTERGDSMDLAGISSTLLSTAVTLGDADSVAVAVQFTGNEVDSKIIVTPVIFDDNDSIISILEPKSFNMVFDSDNNELLRYTPKTIWDIDGAESNHVESTFSIGELGGMQLTPDGTRLIWSDSSLSKWNQGTLSTPYDITTYGNQTQIDNSADDEMFRINPAGTVMLVFDASVYPSVVKHFDLSTPWDITTAVQDVTKETEVDGGVTGFSVSDNGLHLYIMEGFHMFYYTMSSAWDITTITYEGHTSYYSLLDGNEWTYMDCKINNDGTKLVVVNQTELEIDQFSFSTPYDPTTASLDSSIVYFGSSIENNPKRIEVASDGRVILFSGYDDDYRIHSYDLVQDTPPSIILTPMQTWNSLGALKVGFHIFHDSATKKAVSVDLFAAAISKETPGYNILEKSTSGEPGSFPSVFQYGATPGA